jgi:hypothetical protein
LEHLAISEPGKLASIAYGLLLPEIEAALRSAFAKPLLIDPK